MSQRSSHTRHKPYGQLDRLLLALRAIGPDAYRADPDRLGVWHAYCPGCGSIVRRLTITERRDGSVALTCATGCTTASIVVGLRLAERLYAEGRAPAWLGDQPSSDEPLATAELARIAQRRKLVAAVQRETE